MFSFENCVQVRGLLEQAEEMVESEDLMEEEFNQVMFGFFRNEKEIMIMVMVMVMMILMSISGDILCRDNCQLIGMPYFHTRSAGKNNRN